MTTYTPAQGAGRTAPIQVDNMSFMLERLGKDCGPLQFVRELTKNGIEAIQKTPNKTGKIVWDVDWPTYDLTGVFKLSITDNGVGMTGEEMVRYINHLSSSSGVQSMAQNYGVGAKISAGCQNPAGMVYLSWKDGVGYQCHFWKDPSTGEYGLRQIERDDGSFGEWATVDPELKPDDIDQHGTKVILLGIDPEADTMKAPEGARVETKWIRKFLNSRFANLPEGIEIRVREGWEEPRSDTDINVTRGVTGQIPYVDDHAECSGKVQLSDAVLHWWILKDDKAISQNSGQIQSGGHIAALYQDELYELKATSAGYARLQEFGIIVGQRCVVFYIELDPGLLPDVTTNIARTALLLNSESLPWTAWAAEFRDKIPQELKDHMDSVLSKSQSKDHADSIQKRLKEIESMFQLSRYRQTSNGEDLIDPAAVAPGGVHRERNTERSGSQRGGTTGGSVGSIYALFQSPDGVPASNKGKNTYPQVTWVSVVEGSREQGDLEDRAARYIPGMHHIMINADFRVFVDMIRFWVTNYKNSGLGDKVLHTTITDIVREWFEQQLIETVMSSFGLKASPEWSDKDIEAMLSEEGLTAVVLPRYHTNIAIKRQLGEKLGSLKAKAA